MKLSSLHLCKYANQTNAGWRKHQLRAMIHNFHLKLSIMGSDTYGMRLSQEITEEKKQYLIPIEEAKIFHKKKKSKNT